MLPVLVLVADAVVDFLLLVLAAVAPPALLPLTVFFATVFFAPLFFADAVLLLAPEVVVVCFFFLEAVAAPFAPAAAFALAPDFLEAAFSAAVLVGFAGRPTDFAAVFFGLPTGRLGAVSLDADTMFNNLKSLVGNFQLRQVSDALSPT